MYPPVIQFETRRRDVERELRSLSHLLAEPDAEPRPTLAVRLRRRIGLRRAATAAYVPHRA